MNARNALITIHIKIILVKIIIITITNRRLKGIYFSYSSPSSANWRIASGCPLMLLQDWHLSLFETAWVQKVGVLKTATVHQVIQAGPCAGNDCLQNEMTSNPSIYDHSYRYILIHKATTTYMHSWGAFGEEGHSHHLLYSRPSLLGSYQA